MLMRCPQEWESYRKGCCFTFKSICDVTTTQPTYLIFQLEVWSMTGFELLTIRTPNGDLNRQNYAGSMCHQYRGAMEQPELEVDYKHR